MRSLESDPTSSSRTGQRLGLEGRAGGQAQSPGEDQVPTEGRRGKGMEPWENPESNGGAV